MDLGRGRVPALLAIVSIALLALLFGPAPASASPVLTLDTETPDYVTAGEETMVIAQVRNLSNELITAPITVDIELPEGVTGGFGCCDSSVEFSPNWFGDANQLTKGTWSCVGSPPGITEISCTYAGEPLPPYADMAPIEFWTSIPADASGELRTSYAMTGGEAPPRAHEDVSVVGPPPAGFVVKQFDGEVYEEDLSAANRAAAHPFATTVKLRIGTRAHDGVGAYGTVVPRDSIKDTEVELPPGFLGNPTAVPTCSLSEMAQQRDDAQVPECAPETQVGMALVRTGASTPLFLDVPIFNVEPPPGSPAAFGFMVQNVVILLRASLRSDGDYGVTIVAPNAPTALPVLSTDVTFWGNPADPSHEFPRTPCNQDFNAGPDGERCPTTAKDIAFLTNPTNCSAVAPEWRLRINSYRDPSQVVERSFTNHLPGSSAPLPLVGCDVVPFDVDIAARPTVESTETPSGLEVDLEVPDPGLENPDGLAGAHLKKATVALPQGMTLNPSQAEGLGVCTPAQYAQEALDQAPGEGCPQTSKVATVELETQLLEDTLHGNVYVAQQDDPGTATPGAENPFDSLLALYVVIENVDRGVIVKLPGRVELDPGTGRIVTVFDDLPQLPFERFSFRFREGARAPLVSPPTCGTHTTEAEFVPWSAADPDNPTPEEVLRTESEFTIGSGVGGGPCPPQGTPGFDPGFSAGSLNNSAGAYSPFYLRLTRRDGEQDLTKFSSVLPPGVSARIAGVERCSDAAIAAAKGKTGRAELAAPSCPAGSQIGRILAGAGVGSVLTYIPGKLYLAGPYNGAPLSVVAITPAVAGPFDVGAVVVRQALDLDPATAEVRVDGERSDPIPHILEGIPLKIRDVRVYVDRERFTINPTSCDPDEVLATLWGSSTDVFSVADDVPVGRASRYQAASCQSLGFRPKLRISLRGGSGRGAYPALRAVLTPRPGDANLRRTSVVLPPSAFLEQGHIRTICTRVQFAAGAGQGAECPKGSVYGRATAWSPLLDEPLRGPVYLRSSNHQLPDMVLALGGVVDIEAVGRIDSVSLGGGDTGIRSVFAATPDAPLSRVVLEMQGGKKGLIVNSRDLCRGENRARARLVGHNGKVSSMRPLVRATGCGKASGRGSRRR